MKSGFRLITLWVILAMLIVPAIPAAASGGKPEPSPIISAAEEANWSMSPVPLMYDPNPIPVRVEAHTPAADRLSPSGATFIIDYIPNGSTNELGDDCVTFPEQAKVAFQDAANKLGALINSSVPIRIEGCWAVLPEGVLGHSATISNHRNFAGSVPGVWYPVALANALYKNDLKPASGCTNAGYPASFCDDISIAYAVDFTDYFYYGTDGNPGSKIDLESVVMHEIMHGLGFAGGMWVYTVSNVNHGAWGMEEFCDYPTSYDRFTVDNNNVNLTNLGTYPCESVALANVLTSGNIYFTGANAKAANANARVPLYAPSPWRGGSSYSHLAEIYNGTNNAMMTYSIGAGESIHDPGSIGLGVLRDVGWPAPATYAISGQVLLSSGGSASGVTVSDGAGHTANTDSNGNYTISGLASGTYTITPSKAGYTFTPSNRSVNITNADQTGVNFTMITYSISGQVLDSSSKAAVGVTISDGAGHTVTTDASGNYTLASLASGNYTITPSKTGYSFTQANRSVTITTANQTGINFTMVTYSVSGQVTLNGDGGAVGVTVSDGAGHSATSNASGNYTITGMAAGTYTITPSKTGYVFDPTTRSATITNANLIGFDFSVATHLISGKITLSGGGNAVGVSVSAGAGHTTLTSATGDYTLSNLPPGSYTVVPFKLGKVFNPSSRTVVIVASHMTENNFTALPGRNMFIPIVAK